MDHSEGGSSEPPVRKVGAPAAKRPAVAHLQTTPGMSEPRAGAVVGTDCTSLRCWSRRVEDGDLRPRRCELAQQRRRFGYRRLHILLRRDDLTINRKKTQRLHTSRPDGKSP